jgi:hypothetical protein
MGAIASLEPILKRLERVSAAPSPSGRLVPHGAQKGMRKQCTGEQRERLIAEVRAGETLSVVAKRIGMTSSSACLWMKAAAPASTCFLFRIIAGAHVRSVASFESAETWKPEHDRNLITAGPGSWPRS